MKLEEIKGTLQKGLTPVWLLSSSFTFYSVTTCLCKRRAKQLFKNAAGCCVFFSFKITIKQVWPFESQLHGLLSQRRTRYHLGSSLEKCFHCAGAMNAKYLFFELVHNSSSVLSWNRGWGHVEDICRKTIMICTGPKVCIILFYDLQRTRLQLYGSHKLRCKPVK